MGAIVSTSEPVLLLGGADPGPGALKAALNHARFVVAADGGADHALRAGLEPVAVIGDMDSLSDAARAAFAGRLHEVAEQDSTDFEKCLSRIEAPMILALGFLGGRMDHALAVLHGMLAFPGQAVVLLGSEDLCLMVPPRLSLTLTLPVGMRLSLLPVLPGAVRSRGLRWDLSGQRMEMGRFIGSSNEVAAPQVQIEAEPGLALFMPPEALGAALDGLRSAFRGQ